MGLALLDCPTGLAGNMLLAALLDLGVPEDVIHRPLAALGLGGAYRLEISERRSGGLRGLHLAVHGGEGDPPHRTWQALRRSFEEVAWPRPLRSKVMAVFTLLAEAEAAVHGHAPDEVHFHEVGALDALVDVVGVCAALLHLGIDRLECTPPPAGHGTVATAHGTLPVPAPAVLEMARRRRIPLASSQGFPPAELTTPTGLALAACWVDRFALPPAHVPRQVGVGLGSRALDRPNLLRLVLAEATTPAVAEQPLSETLLLQEAQIDDATPEDLAVLQDRLRQAGALEVFCQAIVMKKGRAAWLVSALVALDAAEGLRHVWWHHSTSLGLREQLQQRWALPRRVLRLETALGPVRWKQALLPDGRWRGKPEHEDLLQLAARHDLALEQVREAVHRALMDPGGPELLPWDAPGAGVPGDAAAPGEGVS